MEIQLAIIRTRLPEVNTITRHSNLRILLCWERSKCCPTELFCRSTGRLSRATDLEPRPISAIMRSRTLVKMDEASLRYTLSANKTTREMPGSHKRAMSIYRESRLFLCSQSPCYI